MTDTSALTALLGEKVFIRTVTYHAIGHVESVAGGFVQLSTASFVADTGYGAGHRYSDTLRDGFGRNAEYDPFPDDLYVATAAIVDVTLWRHALPTTAQ